MFYCRISDANGPSCSVANWLDANDLLSWIIRNWVENKLSLLVAFIIIIIEAVGTISDVFNIRCNIFDPIYYVTSDVLNVFSSSLSCFVDPLSYILSHIIDPSDHIFTNFFEEIAICKMVSPFTNILNCITNKSFYIIHDSIDKIVDTVPM